MNKAAPIQASPGASPRFLPALLILFAASGCAALIYEIVWYQLLQLVIGSTAVSLGVLLATFMGGLCLGSIGLPRYLRPGRHPLRVYALLEVGIGACGLLALIGMPLIGGIYSSAVGHGFPSIVLRAVVCAICLMPPTILMGASLPAAARWVETTLKGVSWLGLLYGGNTAGAVFGCLLAGFYLLRVYDMATATFVAAALNAGVALTAWLLAARSPHKTPPPAPVEIVPAGYWPVYVAIALSGAGALGAEVVWTRLLGLMLGATVYTFAIILTVFLVGLGIGSAVGAALLRNLRPRAALGGCQLLLVLAVAWSAYQIAQSLPFWPINPFLSASPWYTLQLDMARCFWAVLPAALLWGASFPFALAAAAQGGDPARLVGRVYAANTAGAIVGALTFSAILVPWLGTRRSEGLLILIPLAGALVVLAPLVRRSRSQIGAALLAASAVAALFLAFNVSDVPGELIAYGRRMMITRNSSEILFTAEGINSSIAISRWSDGAVQFHVSGKVEASTEPYDMRLQRMLGHLPALIHPAPRSVLVVGFGAGVTAGTFVLHPTIDRIVICEMEPVIPRTAKIYFHEQHYDVLDDPRTHVVFDDARHYVLTTPEKFDIITSDPIHPFVKGSATLYSKEYFEMVKEKLNPGGVVTQWVPLYESDADTVKSEIATFFDAFPNGTIWANELSGGGYDLVLLGQAEPTRIDVDAIQHRLDQPDYARVAQSIQEVGLGSAVDLFATYAGRASDLRPWLLGAELNRDGNLRLQYLAGMAFNNNREGAIYSEMLNYRVYPEDLFTASEQKKVELMSAMHASDGR
ncbi:MAG: fused MFS/spermidine synthase [Bryobacteraceae bacterium]